MKLKNGKTAILTALALMATSVALEAARAVVAEVTFRIPQQAQTSEKPYQFFLSMAGACRGQVGEAIVTVNANAITGNIDAVSYPGAADRAVTLRFELDTQNATVACLCDGKPLATRAYRRVSTAGPRFMFGDGASVVHGIVEIASVKIGVVK